MSNTISLTPLQFAVALTASIKARRRVLVKGAPGIGKTQIIEAACNALNADIVKMHPSVSDPTDFKGMPFVVDTGAEFLPFGDLRRVQDAKKLTVVFLDDLGQATNQVQAACMSFFDHYRNSKHIVFVAATNRRSDRAGVSGLLEPVKSRFDTILELRADAKSWAQWALNHGIDYRLIAYLRDAAPDALHKFEPTADIVNQPCPRTWESADAMLKIDISDEDVRFAMLCGAVGDAAATGLMAFIKIADQAPSADEIFADPANCRIPEEPSAVYAVSAALAHYADDKNFGAISTYVQRMYKADHGEFCAVILKDILRKLGDKISKTAAFAQLARTPLAELVMEAVRFNNGGK